MANRTLIVATLVMATLLLSAVSFAAYHWTWGSQKGKRMLPAVRQELSAIPIPNSNCVVKEYESYKSTHALAGRALSSTQKWDEIREFYLTEMKRLGWEHIASKDLKEWQKDVGSKAEMFKKEHYSAGLYYQGSSTRYDWTYALDVSRGR